MYPVRVVVECVCVQIIIWKVRYSIPTLSLFFCSVFICALMFYVCEVMCVSVVSLLLMCSLISLLQFIVFSILCFLDFLDRCRARSMYLK